MSEQDASGNRPLSAIDFTPAVAPGKQSLLARISPLKALLLGVFVLLAVLALFMFNVRSVEFSTLPETAKLEFTSGWPVYSLGGRQLMLSGDYTLVATAPGYAVHTETVSVNDLPEQTFEILLSRLPGILKVSSAPVAGAQVSIDQAVVGLTPLTLEAVAAGEHSLSLQHPRYLPYQTEISIEGMRIEQEVTGVLSPAWAVVSISSQPAAARLVIDDVELPGDPGLTPTRIELLAGQHKLMLRKPGYAAWHTPLSIVPQEDVILPEVILIKAEGLLRLSSEPAGANITLGDNYYGQTPLDISLAPREDYALRVTKAGYQAWHQPLRIAPEEEQELHLVLVAHIGTLQLAASPAGGTLFVNGEERGPPNQTLELPARRHQLRIEHPDYATWETTVTLQPGLSQALEVQLLTEAETKLAATPQQLSSSLGDELTYIQPGKMRMGANRREPGRRSNEIEKELLLTRAYYLGKTEISNKSFRAYDHGHDSGKLIRALLNEDSRPVVNVSWDQVARFCNWLSKQEGLPPAYIEKNGYWQLKQPTGIGYRLPTEAEWAWAARYATEEAPSRFPWGDAMPPLPGSGNFADESAIRMVPQHISNYNDNYRGPAPSGTFAANALGIFDLAGNVSEWIHDYYSVAIHRELLTDPVGPPRGDYHVIRGSNYTQGRFSELRWTYRDYGTDARPDVGFRIARYAE